MAIWSGRRDTKKFQVKVKVVRLEGVMIKENESSKMAVEVKWEGNNKAGLSSLYKNKKTHFARCLITKETEVSKLGDFSLIEWNDHEFDNVCGFSMVSKDNNSFAPWMVSFHVLYGDNEEPSSSSARTKMQVIGKAGINLAELASEMKAQTEQNIPMSLEVNGFAMEASLVVLVSFIEMRNNSNSPASNSNAENSGDIASILRRAKSQGASSGQDKHKKSRKPFFAKQSSLRNLFDSSAKSTSESEYVVVASSSKSGESNSMTELGSSSSSEAQLDLVKKGGFWKWKRRRSKNQAENTDSRALHVIQEGEKCNNPGTWEVRDLVCRDGKTKLKANVFFASYDQRSEKASGESACAAIVAVIAHWLQMNPDIMFTGAEFDRLITEGSSEWRRLCKEESSKDFFPDQHFDLETILQAELRPLAVLPNNSLFGFFHPEEFDHLKGAKSFDEIWDDINKNVSEFESRVYIVRWNDHFFIMKIEANTNYIIDSLGERLYEGCNQAYILKFDDSTVMHEKKANGGKDEVICRGKECCREYMKRFMAAIPLRELKEQEAKEKTVNMFALYQRLQIDFHLSTPSSNVSTANASAAASPNTSPLFLGDDDVEV